MMETEKEGVDLNANIKNIPHNIHVTQEVVFYVKEVQCYYIPK